MSTPVGVSGVIIANCEVGWPLSFALLHSTHTQSARRLQAISSRMAVGTLCLPVVTIFKNGPFSEMACELCVVRPSSTAFAASAIEVNDFVNDGTVNVPPCVLGHL
jgi:hypothetical protein